MQTKKCRKAREGTYYYYYSSRQAKNVTKARKNGKWYHQEMQARKGTNNGRQRKVQQWLARKGTKAGKERYKGRQGMIQRQANNRTKPRKERLAVLSCSVRRHDRLPYLLEQNFEHFADGAEKMPKDTPFPCFPNVSH